MNSSIFESERVALRPFEPEDAPALGALLNDPRLAGRRYVPWDLPQEIPLSRRQVESVIETWAGEKNAYHLAVILKENGELIGHAECDWSWDPHTPSFVVVIAPERWRQGYGAEVARLVQRYFFDYTPAHNVACWIDSWNEGARDFLLALGFHDNGGMRRAGFRNGVYYALVVMDKLRPEWQREGGA